MTRPSPGELAAVGAPVLYSPEEAAAILPGKTAHWLKKKAREGKIPHARIGRTVMFTPADLTEIAREGARKPRPAPGAVVLASRARRTQAQGGRVLQSRVPPRKRIPVPDRPGQVA